MGLGPISLPIVVANLPTGNNPGADLDDNFNALNAQFNVPPPFFRSGMNLINDSVTPNTVLDVGTGAVADSADAVWIQLSQEFFGSTGGTWTAGAGTSGSPVDKMGNGLTVAINTWYHVYAIINASAADIYFDTSASAANAPAGTTAYRWIGAFLTDGSGNIVPFIQIGNKFVWSVPRLDVNAVNIPDTSAHTASLSAPPGFRTEVEINVNFTDTQNSTEYLLVTYPGQTDTAPSASAFSVAVLASLQEGTMIMETAVNTSQKIRYRSSDGGAGRQISIITNSWAIPPGATF